MNLLEHYHCPAAIRVLLVAGALCMAFTGQADAKDDQRTAEPEKSDDDPTKIATKVGVSYSDEFSLSGSIAVGPKLKFNGRISESSQWSIGASYLFPVAILTFSAGRKEFDSGVTQTRYSLGGFVPLNELGLKTGKFMLFVPFGYSYTKGQQAVTDIDQTDSFPIVVSSNSAYVGVFVLRPLNEKFTLMGGANVTKGTNDFSGISVGGGVSYHLTEVDTLGISGSYIDNSFGQDEKIRFSFRHEF